MSDESRLLQSLCCFSAAACIPVLALTLAAECSKYDSNSLTRRRRLKSCRGNQAGRQRWKRECGGARFERGVCDLFATMDEQGGSASMRARRDASLLGVCCVCVLCI